MGSFQELFDWSIHSAKNEEKSSSETHTGTDDDDYMDSDAVDGDNCYPLFISDDLLKNGMKV
jgi:hypothetical protein